MRPNWCDTIRHHEEIDPIMVCCVAAKMSVWWSSSNKFSDISLCPCIVATTATGQLISKAKFFVLQKLNEIIFDLFPKDLIWVKSKK